MNVSFSYNFALPSLRHGQEKTRNSVKKAIPKRGLFDIKSNFLTFILLHGFQKHIFFPFPNEKHKYAFILFIVKNLWMWKHQVLFIFLCTSVCPDPSCWWSGSSVRWWKPVHPSSAALVPDPPDSSHYLNVETTVCDI